MRKDYVECEDEPVDEIFYESQDLYQMDNDCLETSQIFGQDPVTYDDSVSDVEEIGPPKEPFKKNKGGRPQKPLETDKHNMYDEKFVGEFIDEIHQYPEIWDGGHKDFHRTDRKMIIFAEMEVVFSKFLRRGKQHGKCAKFLWDSLVTDYKKFYMRINKTGTGAATTSKQTFKFADHLYFLNGPMKAREVKNAYVIGDRRSTVSEVRSGTKRGLGSGSFSSFESPHKSQKMEFLDTFKSIASNYEKSNKKFLSLFDGKEKETSTKWSNVLTVLDGKLGNWSKLDQLVAEGQIISFISALTPNSQAGTSSNTYNSTILEQ
ncbi:unnamed protein product [Caenorhabditis brenneri]